MKDSRRHIGGGAFAPVWKPAKKVVPYTNNEIHDIISQFGKIFDFEKFSCTTNEPNKSYKLKFNEDYITIEFDSKLMGSGCAVFSIFGTVQFNYFDFRIISGVVFITITKRKEHKKTNQTVKNFTDIEIVRKLIGLYTPTPENHHVQVGEVNENGLMRYRFTLNSHVYNVFIEAREDKGYYEGHHCSNSAIKVKMGFSIEKNGRISTWSC